MLASECLSGVGVREDEQEYDEEREGPINKHDCVTCRILLFIQIA